MDSERLFDLRQLEAFAAVISTGSVTGAAKVIGKSQPVVSRLIQELESDLGFDLFTRYGRRITPTENGVSFYREVERLLDDARRTRLRAEDMSARRTESVEIVSTAAMASTIVPSALRILKERGNLPPNVTVRIQTSEAVIQSVASGAAAWLNRNSVPPFAVPISSTRRGAQSSRHSSSGDPDRIDGYLMVPRLRSGAV